MGDRNGMSLKPMDGLRKLHAGLDPQKETVVDCQRGVRGSETTLGFRDVKVCEPSWLGYAGMLGAPADNEVFVNVGALNGQIALLQNRLRSLEANLTKLQSSQPPR